MCVCLYVLALRGLQLCICTSQYVLRCAVCCKSDVPQLDKRKKQQVTVTTDFLSLTWVCTAFLLPAVRVLHISLELSLLSHVVSATHNSWPEAPRC